MKRTAYFEGGAYDQPTETPMERREEIARLTLEYVTGKSWNTGKPDSATDAMRRAHRELADAILALDWTEPGLRRALEIAKQQSVPPGRGERAYNRFVRALKAEINGGTDGLG